MMEEVHRKYGAQQPLVSRSVTLRLSLITELFAPACINTNWQPLTNTSANKHIRVMSQIGPVVRTGPNDVSFTTVEAFKEIYGPAAKGKPLFLKSDFYNVEGQHPSILFTQSPEDHARQKRYLAPAFSAKSLREQEPIVRQYIDDFLDLLGRLGAPEGDGVPITEAFNWLTFDVIGSWL
jgi:cytochrome P450